MKGCCIFLLILYSSISHCQQYGVQWVIGDKESVLDFRNDTLMNYPIDPVMSMFLTSANICSASGNLLYYTNGIYIAGADGNQITNGGGINPCDYTSQLTCCGLNIPQAALFLPKPGDSSRYLLLHFSNDTASEGIPGTLYYTEILDSALGVVEKKNAPFGKGMFREGGMTACKHANGRDWWVIMGMDNSNEYSKYLVTPDSIFGPYRQYIGPSYGPPYDLPYCKFSQDGTKYAVSCYEGLILLMDFDRCSGNFSNPVTIFNQACDSASPCSGAAALEFSPNAKLLYVSTRLSLNQYYIGGASPQQDSTSLYVAQPSDQAQMHFLQLAPNGKIYCSAWAGGYYFLHLVNYPDSVGPSAQYVDTGFITLTINSLNLPNMVNYQLGPLIGSGCDTIGTSVGALPNALNSLRAVPNPADKYLYVEMSAPGNYKFDLLNELGQRVAGRETRQVDNFDTENLLSGVYFLIVTDKASATILASRKVVVVH